MSPKEMYDFIGFHTSLNPISVSLEYVMDKYKAEICVVEIDDGIRITGDSSESAADVVL